MPASINYGICTMVASHPHIEPYASLSTNAKSDDAHYAFRRKRPSALGAVPDSSSSFTRGRAARHRTQFAGILAESTRRTVQRRRPILFLRRQEAARPARAVHRARPAFARGIFHDDSHHAAAFRSAARSASRPRCTQCLRVMRARPRRPLSSNTERKSCAS